ncbi:MAG: hypothetical protein DSY42_00320 [Aquifex sp.]|nr:MAG: hypothetical protein DSY42_00320 [Aquifex sp.]
MLGLSLKTPVIGFVSGVIFFSLSLNYYLWNRVDDLKKEVSILKTEKSKLLQEVKNISERCKTHVEELKKSYEEKIRLLENQKAQERKVCKKLLKRRSKLEGKLEEIDSL